MSAALPRHVAIIMDGNGRWAKQNKVVVALGHRRGVESLREIVRTASNVGIEVLSLYAFSTENWRRSPAEVSALMALILEFFRSEIDELHRERVRIRILGDRDGLPPPQRRTVMDAEVRTQHNTGMQLNIALNYGGRDEIVRAARTLASQVSQGQISPEEITDELFQQHLYTVGQPDVDLLIRTSGELRISNFLLYQVAYAEMIFPEKLWPDFSVQDFRQCLDAFAARSRRFGGRSE